jgi:hypothetical protein
MTTAIPEPSLSSRAMQCSLSISMWSARKHDPETSEEIAQPHGAQPDADRYHSADRGERQKQILRGVYLERQSEILRFAQNDSEWARSDRVGGRRSVLGNREQGIGNRGETVSGTVPAVSPLPADRRNGT